MYPNNFERKAQQLVFHLSEQAELNAHEGPARQAASMVGINPKYQRYQCGACGAHTSGRVLCDVTREDGQLVSWCLCSCERKEPTIITQKNGHITAQLPMCREFHAKDTWPESVRNLYEEAAKCFTAGAYTACAMVCRKILMAVACIEGDQEDKSFVSYVNYITTNVLVFQRAKTAIEKIKDIGNEANHLIEFVQQDGAKQSLQIVTYMLDAIYALPEASTDGKSGPEPAREG